MNVAETPKKITSADIRTALKLRFPPQSHALMFEVAPCTGGGTRYADAVAVGLWASHGHAIEGIEIKVSRSDFLNEMKQPEKSQPVFEFCNRWWLACPKDMVKPEELPPTWGLLEFNGESLRQRVKAPKLDPKPIDIGFLAALIRRHAGLDEEMAANAIRARLRDGEAEYRARVDRDYTNRYNARMRAAEEAMAVIEKVKDQTGIDFTAYENRNDDFIQAVRIVSALRRDWSGIRDLRRAATNVLQTIDNVGLIDPPDDDGNDNEL